MPANDVNPVGVIPAGTWVEIEQVVLTPDQRAPGIPADTAATPLMLWVNGFLDSDAALGGPATIRTLIGRKLDGRLVAVNPGYTHSFGATVPELLTIGTPYDAPAGDTPEATPDGRALS